MPPELGARFDPAGAAGVDHHTEAISLAPVREVPIHALCFTVRRQWCSPAMLTDRPCVATDRASASPQRRTQLQPDHDQQRSERERVRVTLRGS